MAIATFQAGLNTPSLPWVGPATGGPTWVLWGKQLAEQRWVQFRNKTVVLLPQYINLVRSWTSEKIISPAVSSVPLGVNSIILWERICYFHFIDKEAKQRMRKGWSEEGNQLKSFCMNTMFAIWQSPGGKGALREKNHSNLSLELPHRDQWKLSVNKAFTGPPSLRKACRWVSFLCFPPLSFSLHFLVGCTGPGKQAFL